MTNNYLFPARINGKPEMMMVRVNRKKCRNISFWIAPQIIYNEPVPARTGAAYLLNGPRPLNFLITHT